MGPLAPEAVDDDSGEHEQHGDEPDQVGQMLRRSGPVVVMGCRSEMDDEIEREGRHGERDPEVDEARHAGDLPTDPPRHLYH